MNETVINSNPKSFTFIYKMENVEHKVRQKESHQGVNKNIEGEKIETSRPIDYH